MAQKRASFDASELASFATPLPPSRDHSELLEPLEGQKRSPHEMPPPDNRVRTFHAVPLSASSDPLVSYHAQLRHSQVEALKRLKQERGIVPAEFIRDAIESALRR